MESQPLDFEKPVLELQRRLQELKSHSEKHDIDFDSEVESMELKIRETRRDIARIKTVLRQKRAQAAAPASK